MASREKGHCRGQESQGNGERVVYGANSTKDDLLGVGNSGHQLREVCGWQEGPQDVILVQE